MGMGIWVRMVIMDVCYWVCMGRRAHMAYASPCLNSSLVGARVGGGRSLPGRRSLSSVRIRTCVSRG